MRALLTPLLSLTICMSAIACGGTAHQNLDPEVTEMNTQENSLVARRDDVSEVLHGIRVDDPYRWLEDISNPEVVSWMDTQDAHARTILNQMPGVEDLKKRFAQLYYVDSVSAPVRRGNAFFYSRRHADKEKAIHYVRQGRDGAEEVLLDPNTMSEDGSVSVGFVVASWDGTKVAYSVRENNADESVMYVMDVATRNVSTIDVIPGIKYSRAVWTPDGSGFYYVYLPTVEGVDVADRPGLMEIRYHKLGTPHADDILVRESLKDPKVFMGVDLSRDGRWLFMTHAHGWNRSDIYVRDLSKPGSDFVPVVVGQPNLYYTMTHQNELFIMTNEDASRWRVMKTNLNAPERKNWKEIIPEFADGSVIENAQIIGGRLVLTITKDVVSDMRIHDLSGKLLRDIELPGVGSTFGMTGNPEDDEAYFSFQSFTVPNRIYRTSIATGTTSLWAQVEVPVDPSPYVVEQVFYPSKDGTQIPMFIIRRADLVMDGTTPTLLYGYGGFNVTMYPYFMASIYPWLEAGGVYAVANLRGGGEYGKDWHFAGARENKQNVFDDFIAAAEYLVEKKYTSPKNLGIRGGSNGGLLVGAVMAQRPELFGAVVCAVPLLDMLRYHLFGSGKTWIAEYGDPENAEDFKILHSYSPYHQLKQGTAYPPFLMLAADSDDRVDPMHARKMVAALQHAQASKDPILLRVERNAGHGGADMVKNSVEKDAEMYAFLLHVLSGAAKSPE